VLVDDGSELPEAARLLDELEVGFGTRLHLSDVRTV
jgi:hypothetical protein